MINLLNGIDRLEQYASLFEGKRLGLITTPTGLNRSGETTIDVLQKRFGLSALFSPEHGVRGDHAAGDCVEAYIDEETGVPVYSLYRKDSKHLTAEMLQQVDAVVYDIQDVGTRYYTFISTLLCVLKDCADAGKKLIVLDRPDPLGGEIMEGNIVRSNFLSFVGAYPLCMRYGLTAGEFARMATSRLNLSCNLDTIPCTGWRREMQFPDYGTVWVPPSPNIPRFETALLYPGTCLFEGTNYSEGRGTANPFEVIGAPSAKAAVLAREMNRKHLPGVWFRPIFFIPTDSKHRGVPCQGVQIHVTDRHLIRPVDVGIHLLWECQKEDPEFTFLPDSDETKLRAIDRLGGDSSIGDLKIPPDELLASYREESSVFRKQVQQYLLY